MTGSCGNLTFEKRDDSGEWEDCDVLSVGLGSIAKLKKAMTTTGNHKLDMQLTITALLTEDDEWIIPK